jgi:O-succinylbenzoic acid--CoA ligase
VSLFPSHIILNGRSTEVNALIQNRAGVARWEEEWMDFLAEGYGPDDSIFVNTSGSTGKPKAIRLSKKFVAASARRTLLYFGLKGNDRVLHCLPSRYIAGKLMVVRSLLGQLDMHVADPSTDFSFLKDKSFQFAAMVPNQVSKILDSQNGINRLLQIKKLLIGGSSVPAKLQERLQNRSTDVYSSYATTETATHIAIRKINVKEADSFYHCMEGISVSLSPEGCLRLHIPGLDEEFLQTTESSNSKTECNETYLQTTDLAELKDEKTFRILGRADHVIISGGIKFSPEQLEQKLEKAIKQPFMITSLPDDKLGEQMVLLIEGDEDPEAGPQLKEICRQHLDQYECPRQIRFTPRLPRTPNGKLKRGPRLP